MFAQSTSNVQAQIQPLDVSDVRHPDHWKRVGHFYEPIPLYGGRVLKYCGFATEGNRGWMMVKPGMQILDAYLGDRIRADDHSLFTSF